MSNKNYRFETRQLHTGQELEKTGARAVPIYQTVAYVFKDFDEAANRFGLSEAGNIYGRLTNPTQEVLEKRIASLEGGVAGLAFSSGAAAITATIQTLLNAGDHIVSAKQIYGGSFNLFANTFPKWGITTSFVDAEDVNNFGEAIKENTKLIFIETIGNPNSSLVDIEKIAQIAHHFGIPLVVDNTFGTPYLIRPIEYGADIVIHSATKFLGGHGTSLGGVIVDSGNFDWQQNDKFPNISQPDNSYHGIVWAEALGNQAFITRARAVILRDTGAAISPFNAFIILQGIETLSLRMERHIANTLKVVEFLDKHPKVERVEHPVLKTSPYHGLYKHYFPQGGASIFTFNIKGGKENAKKFINNLELFSLLANVGDAKSLVIHPASTTHSQLNETDLKSQNIFENTIRLSIGLENIEDILADLERALGQIN